MRAVTFCVRIDIVTFFDRLNFAVVHRQVLDPHAHAAVSLGRLGGTVEGHVKVTGLSHHSSRRSRYSLDLPLRKALVKTLVKSTTTSNTNEAAQAF